MAVAVTAMLETWSEGKGPPYGVQASPLKPGTKDTAGIAWAAMAARSAFTGSSICSSRTAFARHSASTANVPSLSAGADRHRRVGPRHRRPRLLPGSTPHLHDARGGARNDCALARRLDEGDRPAPAGLDQSVDGVHRTYARISRRGEVAVARRCPRQRPAAPRRHAGRIDRAYPRQRFHRQPRCDRARSTCGTCIAPRSIIFTSARRRPSWCCPCTATSAAAQ